MNKNKLIKRRNKQRIIKGKGQGKSNSKRINKNKKQVKNNNSNKFPTEGKGQG